MIERVSWIVLALVHALPAVALVRPALIGRLYGVVGDDPVLPLLHHRAALFAVILLLCIWATIDPTIRRAASASVGLSMISFLAIYWGYGSPVALRSIAIADLVGLPFLAVVGFRAFATQ